MKRLLTGQLKPLFRIGFAFVLVWFFHGLTSSFLDGLAQLVGVVAISIGVWMVVVRALFPVEAST